MNGDQNMGTRASYAVIIDGQTKTMYCHWDGYPSGLGMDIVNDLRTVDSLGWLREKARELRIVCDNNDCPKPTPEDQAKLRPLADTKVSKGTLESWYCLTRGLQGNLLTNLTMGYGYDGENAGDTEWAYEVDLDQNTFRVYKRRLAEGSYWIHMLERPLTDLPEDMESF